IAVANAQGSIQVWNTLTGKLRCRLAPPLASTSWKAVALSPNGKTLAARSFDQMTHVWDAVGEKELCRFNSGGRGFAGQLARLTLAPDRKSLAATDGGCKVRRWDIATGKEFPMTAGHSGRIIGLGITADGKRAATLGDDANVCWWDVAT